MQRSELGLKLNISLEDKIRLDRMLLEMADIIHRSSDDPSLALDFEHWAQVVFGHKRETIRTICH